MVSAYLMDQEPPPLPPEQGPYGLTDSELFEQIVNDGDPLGSMSFSEAVNADPRRVEGQLLQRVIEPFYLAVFNLEHSKVDLAKVRAAMRHAYLQRNADMRKKDGRITAAEIADATERSWRMNSEIFRVNFEMRTAPAQVLQQLMTANRQDIRRAFRESNRIATEASRASGDASSSQSWQQVAATLKNMADNVEEHISTHTGEEVIDDEIMWIQEPEQMAGTVSRSDLFGGVSLKPNLDVITEVYGQSEHEEYILTGHRAPSVGLGQYRRMGGRVY
jgi:hypothetical protein